jgi:outer membrane biosynthesis protein TonB
MSSIDVIRIEKNINNLNYKIMKTAFLLVLVLLSTMAYAQDLETAEEMPYFPKGNVALTELLQKKLKYPPDAWNARKHGRIVVRFVVDKSGKIRNAAVVS